MRLTDFLRSDPVVRANFLRLAGQHVWKRIVRDVERE